MALSDILQNYRYKYKGNVYPENDLPDDIIMKLAVKQFQDEEEKEKSQEKARTLSRLLKTPDVMYDELSPEQIEAQQYFRQNPAQKNAYLQNVEKQVQAKQDAGGTFTDEDLLPYKITQAPQGKIDPQEGIRQALEQGYSPEDVSNYNAMLNPQPKAKNYKEFGYGQMIDESGNIYKVPVKPEKTEEEKPLTIDQAAKLRNPETGEQAPLGITMNQAIKEGYVPLTTDSVNKSEAMKSADIILNKLESKLTKIPLPSKDAPIGFGRMGTAPWYMYQKLSQDNTDIATFQSYAQGTLAPLIRSLGEKGNLSDNDIERAINLVPKILPTWKNRWTPDIFPDTKETAKQKMIDLRDTVKQLIEQAYKSKTVSTSQEDPLGIRR